MVYVTDLITANASCIDVSKLTEFFFFLNH